MLNSFFKLLVLTSIILSFGCTTAKPNTQNIQLCGFNVDQYLCDIPLVDQRNICYSTDEFTNRNMIIHFMTAWSQDSCELAGVASYLQNRYENANVIIVLLETYTGYEIANSSFLDDWVNDCGVNVPAYTVPSEMSAYFPDRYFPVTFVVDDNLKIKAKTYGTDLVELMGTINFALHEENVFYN